MGYNITLQDIIDAVRYDTRVQSAAAVIAVLIMVMMFTGGNSLSEDPRQNSWDGAGRAMSTCQIQAQSVAPADRGVFVGQCLARQR